MGDVYTLLCLRSAELSKSFGLRNLCYSKISVVMFLGYMIAGISRKFESERKKCTLRPNAAYSNSKCLIPLFHTGHESSESPRIDFLLIRGIREVSLKIFLQS